MSSEIPFFCSNIRYTRTVNTWQILKLCDTLLRCAIEYNWSLQWSFGQCISISMASRHRPYFRKCTKKTAKVWIRNVSHKTFESSVRRYKSWRKLYAVRPGEEIRKILDYKKKRKVEGGGRCRKMETRTHRKAHIETGRTAVRHLQGSYAVKSISDVLVPRTPSSFIVVNNSPRHNLLIIY